jgi:cell division protein FtsL
MDPTFGARRKRSLFRRRQTPISHPHGYGRDGENTAPHRELGLQRRAAPAGTTFLLTIAVGVLTAIGIARVQSTTEVLAMGAEISQLTTEQAELLDERRRLAAERAYLRHPDHIEEVARDRLHMIPIAPDLVQKIRLMEDAP